jgi:hypothetical protein
MIPDEIGTKDRAEVFEAVMYIASCQRSDYVLETGDVHRPLRAPDFAQIAPVMLETAGRAIIGGEEGFGAVADRMRAFAGERGGAHGVLKELGPLAAASLNSRDLCEPSSTEP